MAVTYLTHGNDDGESAGLSSAAKISVYGVPPVTQAATIGALTVSSAAASDAAGTLNSVLTALKNFGIIAAA